MAGKLSVEKREVKGVIDSVQDVESNETGPSRRFVGSTLYDRQRFRVSLFSDDVRLRRKVDLRVLPLLIAVYALSLIDR